MKEKIRHLLALKVMERGNTKMSLRQLVQSGGATDEQINRFLDLISSVEEEIEILEKVLKQLKQ